MADEIHGSGERPRQGGADRDMRVRATVYAVLALVAVAVVLGLAVFGRSERVFAAGPALGLDEVALMLEQGSVREARRKLREIAPNLMMMGWDTSYEVDRALQRIWEADREVHYEALRFLTGREWPEPRRPEAPAPTPKREEGPAPVVHPSRSTI